MRGIHNKYNGWIVLRLTTQEIKHGIIYYVWKTLKTPHENY